MKQWVTGKLPIAVFVYLHILTQQSIKIKKKKLPLH